MNTHIVYCSDSLDPLRKLAESRTLRFAFALLLLITPCKSGASQDENPYPNLSVPLDDKKPGTAAALKKLNEDIAASFLFA